MWKDSSKFLIPAFTVLLCGVVSYLFLLRKAKKHDSLSASELRELRALRLQTPIKSGNTTDISKEHDHGSDKQKLPSKRTSDVLGQTEERSSERALNIEARTDSPTKDAQATKANMSLLNQDIHEKNATLEQEIKESPIFGSSLTPNFMQANCSTPITGDLPSSRQEDNVSALVLINHPSECDSATTPVNEDHAVIPLSKHHRAQPPIQELCQELSEAFSVRVQPTSNPGSEWNGTEGWAKSRLVTNTFQRMLELPFAFFEDSLGSESDPLERLYLCLNAMKKANPNVIAPSIITMQWIAKAYGRLRTPSRPELTRCTKLVQEWICSLGAAALDMEMQYQSSQADDDVPGLFADEVVTNTNTSGPSDLHDQLIVLLETLSISSVCLDTLFEASSKPDAWAEHVLKRLMDRIDEDAFTGMSTLDTLSQSLQRLNAIGRFMQSRLVQKRLATEFTKELHGTGRDVENSISFKQLFRLAAYTVPETIEGLDQESFMVRHLVDALSVENTMPAEIAVFSSKGAKGYEQFQRQSRQLMESARTVCRAVIEKSLRATKGEIKGKVFRWLFRFSELNLPLTKMLAADLLSSDGIVAISSTWPFLNGLSTSVMSLCVNRLRDEFDRKGLAAFDPRFLLSDEFRSIRGDFNSLLQDRNGVESPALDTPLSFQGTTKFFFVVSSLLHTSLYPMMRVERSFLTLYNKPLMQLQTMANESQAPGIVSVMSKVAFRGWTGFTTFLDDPILVGDIVNFALLQLQWLLELLQSNSALLTEVPDWMCKEPARWLTHVAQGRSLFIPHQAELTIETTMRLLAAGSNTSSHGRSSKAQFSPVVLTELIHVVSAFVRSGIRKAKKRGHDNNDIDDRSLYLSLDKSNLSTYVYTNEIVIKQLCSVLMNTFLVLDHVEGLNVDAEASFDKYSAKSEISRLLLILWGHPYDDRCRKSMLLMPEADISKFIASLALVVGFLFDDGHQRFVDVCKSLKKQRLTAQERYFMERQKERSTNAFASSRSFLLLLWKLCLETKMAAIMGGSIAAKDIAAMITHVLELIVDDDGGLLAEIDTVELPHRSSEILKLAESDGLEASALRRMVSTLVSHRRSVKKEYGLDASCMAYSLLALATRCHKECLKSYSKSELVESLASQDSCDVEMLRLLVNRHVSGGPKMNSVEENVLLRDGFVGLDVWQPETPSNDSTPSGHDKQRQATAAKDHILAEEIQSHVQREFILEFLDAVAEAKKAHDANTGTSFSAVDSKVALKQLLGVPVLGQDKNYTDSLIDWVVSSQSFASKSAKGSLSHAFDHSAKGHTTTAPGKVMVKEARKCHKNIPEPHPNSAVFVCFAEERMDMCRCLITGPVDTPYAFGSFEFDVFFPPSYPNIPPLVQFMTTGGGRVRFGPNLYLDGKVCLSLLGTFNAQEHSQQWNPSESSLPQVLLSIQTQLLTEDPYFNEPGHESMRHTSVGQEASRSYNLKRSLDTLRYAIIEPLTNPSVGLEEIIYRHFSLCRLQVLAQARRWAHEARGTELEKRFDVAFDRLVAALHSCISEDDKVKYPPLAPRSEDLRFLRNARDSLFAISRVKPQNPWVSGTPHTGAFHGGLGDSEIEDFYT